MKNTILTRLMVAGTILFSFVAAKADDVRLYPHGPAALAKYLDLIESATSTIDIMTFEFYPCDVSGQLILDKLKAKKAANPELQVRLLLDSYSFVEEEWIHEFAPLTKAGIEIKNWNRATIGGNMRNHAKILIIDGKVVFTGGRNLGDRYFGIAKEFNYIDRDVVLSGEGSKAVADAKSGFDTNWSSSISSVVKARRFSGITPLPAVCGNEKEIVRVSDVLDVISDKSNSDTVHSCKDVRFTLDKIHPSRTQSVEMSESTRALKTTTVAVERLLGSVSQEILVENLMMAQSKLIGFFDNFLQRNVKTVVVTNSLVTEAGHGAGSLNRSTARNFYNRSKNVNILLWPRLASASPDDLLLMPKSADGTIESTPFEIHAKTMLIDNSVAVVSSYNMDARSHKINNESLVEIHGCETFNSALRAEIRIAVDKNMAFINKNPGRYRAEFMQSSWTDLMFQAFSGAY